MPQEDQTNHTNPPAGLSARDLIAPVSLVALAVVFYLPAVNGWFIWDDLSLILHNPMLRTASGLWRVWTTISGMLGEEHYWPLQYDFLWVERNLFGETTTGYHVVNMLLHGAVAVYIWRLMRRLGLGAGAWLAAAVFAVHPVHAEVVAWMFSVKDLIATLLFLLVTELFLNYQDRGGWRWLALAGAVAAAAMFIKSSPVMLPFALAILGWYRHGRIERRDAIFIGVLAATVLTIAFIDMRIVAINSIGTRLVVPPFADRLLQSGKAFALYWSKLVWPAGLSPIYPQFQSTLTNPLDWLPLVAAVLITIFLWRARDRYGRGPLACWLFYGVTLGPVLGIVYFGFLMKSPIADRYQYLPSIGPIAGFGALVGGWIGKRRIRAIVAIVMLVALGCVTWIQSGFYRDEVKFFGRAIEITPDSAVAYYNLGHVAWRQRLYPQAERMFAEARRLDPGDNDALYNLGHSIARQGRARETVSLYRTAIDAGCVHPGVWSHLAWILATSPDPKLRDPQKALDIASQVVSRAPAVKAEYLNTLAAALAANGQTAKAASVAKQAMNLARETGETGYVKILEKTIPLYEAGNGYIEK